MDGQYLEEVTHFLFLCYRTLTASVIITSVMAIVTLVTVGFDYVVALYEYVRECTNTRQCLICLSLWCNRLPKFNNA